MVKERGEIWVASVPLQLIILCPAGFPDRMSLVVETVFLVQTGIGSNYGNQIGNASPSPVDDRFDSGLSQGDNGSCFSEDTRVIFPYNDTT